MGLVCCETPPKLTHDDVENSRQQDPSPSLIAGTTATPTAATLPSDHLANNSHRVTLKPSHTIEQAQEGNSIKTQEIKTNQAKKSVRINDEVTQIPLLTSASFFRKTPKPTTIKNSKHGIMPSFRIVAPATVSSTDGSSGSDKQDLVSKASLWWTKEERQEILQANQKASRDFKRFQPTRIRQANLVYNEIVMDCRCRSESQNDDESYDENDISDFFQRQRLNHRTAAGSTANTTTSTIATSSMSHPPSKKRKRPDFIPINIGHSDLPPPTLPDATIDLPGNVRGLEWGIMPDAKRYRKAHARTILRWQDRFRRMNDRRKRRIRFDSTESSSSSSSSSEDDETDSDGDHKNCETTRDHKLQQDLLLGHKASISSLRSCILARVMGKSDEIAANPSSATASDLEKQRSSSKLPTPSLTGTSESSDEDCSDDEDESESESAIESDSDDEDDEDGNGTSYHTVYYSSSLSANPNSHRRMFRPRMMPPMSWR
jgi:hypothetical protein